MATKTDADKAVSSYLTWLASPKQRGRQAKPKPDYTKATEGITDPLKALAAVKAERERVDALAKESDPAEGFKLHAKQWAADNGYTSEDFRAVGVPAKVLTVVFGETKPKAPSAKRTGDGSSSRGVGSLLAKAIADAPKGTVLTLAGLRTEVGGTDQTIAKALAGAMAAGQLSKAEDASYTGRGRKPFIYTKL